MAYLKVFQFVLTTAVVCVGCNPTVTKHNPCCSYPCQNNGICYTKGFAQYLCDCTRTGYYGQHCELAEFSTKIKKFLKPSRESLQHFVTHYEYLWRVVNNVDSLRKAIMRMVLKMRMAIVDEPAPYIGYEEYTTFSTYTNKTVYARTLPPVPLNCPTPMGVKGAKELPDVEEIARKFFLRRKFIPCPRRTNLIFPFFGQHFNHQYFKTDVKKGIPFQWGGHVVDVSHVYGDDVQREHSLRSHEYGKMKVSIVNGEAFPPSVEDAAEAGMAGVAAMKKSHRLAFGHKGFAPLPSFLLFSTIWLREHNRVCEILKGEHPEWDDERLYQTARLIITGETIKIIIEDYVQHLSGFHFRLMYDPDILMNELSHHNQIHLEFHTLYHWHQLIPDTITLQNRTMKLKDLLFNPGPFLETGISGVLKDLSVQFAGQVAGGRNQGSGTLAVAIKAINDGRKLRLQPFNNYRIRFGMTPYATFEELTGETEMAAELRSVYKDIDALELYVGLILEKRRKRQLFGETLTEMGSPYSLKGLYGSPIGSPAWWKPVTFGGDVGFNIVKSASLQKLICDNVDGCPEVSFSVPKKANHTGEHGEVVEDDNTAGVLISLARNLPGASAPNLHVAPVSTCNKFSNNDCETVT